MTMHLANGLTTTRTKKPRNKPLTQKAIDEYTIAWRKHNKDCRRRNLHSFQFESLQAYIKYVRSPKYEPPKKTAAKKPVTPAKPKVNKEIPSHVSNYTGALAKLEKKEYSGDRKLVGIATMHKSNLVPVFEDEEGDARKEATELAHMRR